ncbi:MAG: hypothetical protein WBD69_10130, partial [Candidatus Cybelea sp.]
HCALWTNATPGYIAPISGTVPFCDSTQRRSSVARRPTAAFFCEAGLAKLADYLSTQKSQIAQERGQNGTQARFAKLSSKRFPGGL